MAERGLEANEAKVEGNALFKEGKYEEALIKYDLALQLSASPPETPLPAEKSSPPDMPSPPEKSSPPDTPLQPDTPLPPDMPSSSSATDLRSICHANRAACFSKLGRHKETVEECTKALELNPKYAKALLRRAEAHEKLENFEEAIADMSKILELDPSNDQAKRAIIRLKPLAEEKREKMKDEMIGKLKEMGNSILGRFGMSIDNFKAVKDPNTGSYSVSFQR